MAGSKKLHERYNRVFVEKSNAESLTVPCSFYVVFLCFFVLFCFNDHVTLAFYIFFCCPVSELLSPQFPPLRGVQRASPQGPR